MAVPATYRLISPAAAQFFHEADALIDGLSEHLGADVNTFVEPREYSAGPAVSKSDI